jgi:hypothetical protein
MANLKDSPKFSSFNHYYTPKSAWQQINHLLPKDKIIWEAFMFNSHLSNSKQHLIDLNNQVIGDPSYDFFNMFNKLDYDLIVSNPPFETSIKQNILKKLVEIDKPFIIIMNSMNTFSKYFHNIFKDKTQYLQIITPNDKIHFEKLDSSSNSTKLHKGTSFYSVYVAYKMHLLPHQLWLS